MNTYIQPNTYMQLHVASDQSRAATVDAIALHPAIFSFSELWSALFGR